MVTPARPRPDIAATPDGAGALPDFRLEETLDGWTLTLHLTDRLLDALAGYADGGPAEGFTVDIRPNLVPGEPFPASVVITRPPSV